MVRSTHGLTFPVFGGGGGGGIQQAQALPAALLQSPAGYWPLAGDMVDVSGNGNDLVDPTASPVRYTDLVPGVMGQRQRAFNVAESVGSPAALRITGSMTAGLLFQQFQDYTPTSGAQVLLSWRGTGSDTETENSLYELVIMREDGRSYWFYFHETGAGPGNNRTATPLVSGEALAVPLGPCLIGFSRVDNGDGTCDVTFYQNGLPYACEYADEGGVVPTLSNPTGGTSASCEFRLGNNDATTAEVNGTLASAFVETGVAWSDDDWKAAYNQTLGMSMGLIP